MEFLFPKIAELQFVKRMLKFSIKEPIRNKNIDFYVNNKKKLDIPVDIFFYFNLYIIYILFYFILTYIIIYYVLMYYGQKQLEIWYLRVTKNILFYIKG